MTIDVCVIITGLIKYEYIFDLIKTYENIPNKIVSTWNNQDINLINFLKSHNFIVIQNEYPKELCQTNYIASSIQHGCDKANELGFNHVIKVRSDIACNNMNKLIEIIKPMMENKLTVLSGMYTDDKAPYFFDSLLGGPVTEVKKLCCQTSLSDKRYIEKVWQENYLQKENLNEDDIRSIFNFCVLQLRNAGIILEWKEKGWEIVHCFCARSFTWV